jgi:hypothetical protein
LAFSTTLYRWFSRVLVVTLNPVDMLDGCDAGCTSYVANPTLGAWARNNSVTLFPEALTI